MTEVTITHLDQHGFGQSEAGQKLPRTLPGEVIVLDADTGKQRVVTPSEHRISAPCRHFKNCGGCAMQHAADDFVANWKMGIVKTGLAARGIEARMRPIKTSPPNSRRRATLHGRRTKSGALVGFHARASDMVVEVPDCKLLHPDLLKTVPVLAEITKMAGSRKGEIGFALTMSEGGVDLDVRGAKATDLDMLTRLGELADRADLARLSWEAEPIATRRAPYQRFGQARVVPPPGAFLQATPQGESALVAAVQEAVGDASRVVDLFAGCGTFALSLASDAEILAVEAEAAPLQALDAAWRATPGLRHVATLVRDLFRQPLLPDELGKFDAVVIDPPRAGAEAQIRAVADAQVPVIAAVSCNPVSFARDARILLDAGYGLDWVQVVDQFRWSTHVELVARFSRNCG
ncbi:23S rRNA (uracil-5-)-methyltransferase RumA [Actibacterium atlanticum]|uniref:23S rRNA (Uracil-5-)-methyltransferase RumA n=1 Tax=Actibacterium atlanticum TaxID=1461693 RepID=A0A058ZLR6_9RHOB|nr:RsmD family RNA methyltransferase [Actibacterium atlanticum]KCV82508.1 23S rRNA (uracil-5-)-methyltransferase RumA [Actibacterium atlanticum]